MSLKALVTSGSSGLPTYKYAFIKFGNLIRAYTLLTFVEVIIDISPFAALFIAVILG